MRFLTAISALCFTHAVRALVGQRPIQDSYSFASTIRDTLRDNEVIGDVLDDFEPTFYLDIKYAAHHESVLLGNDIPVKYVQDRPHFTVHAVSPAVSSMDSNATFTLALTDPDAKSRNNPKWSEMCHWLLTNLTTNLPGLPSPPPNDPPIEVLKQAGELKGYKPPGPPPKTGAHRYVFVLLQGESSELKPPTERQHWGYEKPRHGVRDWAKENSLTVVGANFFFAQNTEQ